VFQPIFQQQRGTWQLCAFEALGRGPRGTNLEDAEVLFEYVRRKGSEAIIDRRCVANALGAMGEIDGQLRLSINVHASTLETDGGFVKFLAGAAETFNFPTSLLTIEIVEHSPCWGGPGFKNALRALREIGVCIAVDDIGIGHSNYRMLLECQPEYFKVDRYLVHGSNGDLYRRAVLRSIADLARSVGAHAVAEGVDCKKDLDAVVSEGISMAQGFLLSRPRAASEFSHLSLAAAV
jgi:EAL domain-containing protein (putative c-di-GMP-specific phosphodiesterase class I)